MDITLKSAVPENANMNGTFPTYEEAYWHLTRIPGLAKEAFARRLFALAKTGRASGDNARHDIELCCEWHDYNLSRDVAYKTGLLKSGPGDDYSPIPEHALAFAQELDRILGATHPHIHLGPR